MILPFVREIFAELEQAPGFDRVRRHLSLGAGRRRVSGLTWTARALYLPLMARAAKQPVVVIVADNKAAEALEPLLKAGCELTGAVDPARVVRFPAHDVLPFENLSPHPDVQEQRAAALWKLATGGVDVLIAPVESAAMKLFDLEYYAGLAVTLKRGEEVDIETLTAHLASVGYTPMDLVEMPGQFTRRGGILDVYSPESDRPVRVEFFGDEIETIRKFDPETQRSQSGLDETQLLPLTETPVTEHLLAAVNGRLSRQRVETEDEEMAAEAAAAGGVSVFPGWEFFTPVAGAEQTLLTLVPRSALFVDEPAMVRNQIDRWWNKLEQRHERSGMGSLVRPEDIYQRPEILQASLGTHMGLDLDQLGAVDVLEDDATLGEIELATRPTLRFHGSIPALTEQLKNLMATETRVVLTASHQGDVERLATVLRDYEVPYRLGSRAPRPSGDTMLEEASYMAGDLRVPVIVRSPLASGVVFADAKLIVFGANDLSDEADVTARPVQKKSKTAAFVSDFRDLGMGDYVVHVEHGIAQFRGLKEIEQDGLSVEFMILEFAEGAKLYVPLTRLDLIQKYRSTDTGPAPVLSRLGSQQWTRTKARVRKAMQDMAADLLKLYAERQTAEGNAFTQDNEFQREFEDAFDFTETDDQMTAIRAVKDDMESPTPMDRLLCGDVGYGKTEVAMRAAFKAVQDGKQVAVLTPTTVLSFQHFETFKQRFAQFPIHVEMISRFRTAKEQKDIVERVATGKVDILIGTHRLLSKDIKFQDLGLLVVDEEQRFGVRHKERLKQLRKEIDVLAMSATPIPRTLHMSLVGLRDMSVIETPPKDRMAIQTVVAKFDEKIVRSAIEVELERGGQVFFVHNRVESIYEIAARIQELVPAARVAVAHGQMSENRAGESDARLHAPRVRRAGGDDDHREWARHSAGEYDFDQSRGAARAERTLPVARARGAVESKRVCVPADPAGERVDGDCAAAAGGAEGVQRPGRGIQDCGARPGAARRGQHAGRRAERAYRGGGIRAVHDDAGGRGEGAEGRGQRRTAGHAAQSGHCGAHRRELRAGGKPAAAALQEDCRRDQRSGNQRDSRGDGRPLWRTARRDGLPAGSSDGAAGVRAPGHCADRSQARRAADSVYGERSVDPAQLMRVVSRNAKRGAQFTPQGVLKFPLKASRPDEVLLEIRELLANLAPAPVNA